MTSNEAYKRFLIKCNENDINSNIEISKAEFVLIYNIQKKLWLWNKIKQYADSDEIEVLEELLVTDSEISLAKKLTSKNLFTLPDNYFRYVLSNSLAKKAQCSKFLRNNLVKPKNLNVILTDTNNNPSFEFEETVVNIAGNNLEIYKTDFDITKAYLTYYRSPIDIDIEGYVKQDLSNSTNIDPDISDELVEEIINRCVTEATRNYENTEGFQLSQTREQ